MELPLITVIIPTFNRVHLISETIDSVRNQTFKNWECLIIDDGSTDYSEELLRFYLEKDPRIKFFKRPNDQPKGASSCRNYGLKLSQGEFIQFLDSDDIISSDKFENQLKVLEGTSESVATCKWGRFRNATDYSLFRELKSYNSFQSKNEFLDALADSQGYFPINAYMIPKKLIFKSGLWNVTLGINDDADFMIRIFLNAKSFIFDPHSFALYRIFTSNNLSRSDTPEKMQAIIDSFILIEFHLKAGLKEENIKFIAKAKEEIYANAKAHPEIIAKNRNYFLQLIQNEPSAVEMLLYKFFKRRMKGLKSYFNKF